ncbi:rtr1/RPAP2 family domain-containing protein [Ditylenchus destructor]|nr:rtr1/RPAP2 family domain-containing protein [Ditylenchus destructor]
MEPKTVKVTDASIAKQLEKERERISLESERRRHVYDAICELSDPVSEAVLIEKLKVLDAQSWNEVVEERFLGRLCGYPLCSKSITVDLRKKYVLNRQKKTILDTNHEWNKYCSMDCLGLSQGIRIQLPTEPLWITEDPLNTPQLVKTLGDLKIADHVESSSDEENGRETDDDREEQEFLNWLKRAKESKGKEESQKLKK